MNNRVVYNLGQIQKEMEKIAELVIRRTTEEILNRFVEDYVKGVYKNNPSVYSNGGTKFFEAWEWEEIKKSATQISSTMFYNDKKTESIPNAFDDMENLPYYGFGIHGSEHWKTDDVRELMPAIMNEDIKSTHPITYDRPYKYWDKFISDFVNGGKLKSLVNRIAKENGLTIGG